MPQGADAHPAITVEATVHPVYRLVNKVVAHRQTCLPLRGGGRLQGDRYHRRSDEAGGTAAGRGHS